MIWGRGCNSGDWWLRSPDDNNDNNAYVGLSSGGAPNNNNVDNNNIAVRPDFPRSQKRTGKCPPSVPGGKELVLLHPDKSYLQECKRQMEDLAERELGLCLNEKTHIFPMANGVDYLGWHFYLTDTGKVIKRLRTQNKKKLKRRLKGLQQGYADGRLQWDEIKSSMAATHGHLCHGHTYRLRAKLYNETIFTRRSEDD